MSELITSLYEAPIVKKKNYSYVIHPITDGIPSISPTLLDSITDTIVTQLEGYQPFDRIVTIEAMGIPLAALVSIKMNIPFTIIRKRSYKLKEEISIQQITGYSKANLYINGLKKDDQVVIVDDVLSTGGTLKAILTAMHKIGVGVKKVVIAIDKGTSIDHISQEFDIPISSLVKINILNDKLHIIDD